MIPKGTVLEGCKIKDISRTIKANILICAIERDGDIIIPNGNIVLRGGDIISIVGMHAQQNLFFKELKMATDLPKSMMIVGGSNIAYYLAKLVESTMSVKIIDVDVNRCKELSLLLDKTTIINADAQLPERQFLQTLKHCLVQCLCGEASLIGLVEWAVHSCNVYRCVCRLNRRRN